MIHGVKEFAERSAKASTVTLAAKQAMPSVVSAPHKSAARMLGYALTADTSEAWGNCSCLFERRLVQGELVSITFATLSALKADVLQSVIDSLTWSEGVRGPLPTWGKALDDARFWASGASRQTLKAFLMACFDALSPKDRAAFLAHIAKETA